MRTLITRSLSLAALPALAFAHDGHGAEGLHWHASDALGVLVLGALAAAALWVGRR